MPHSTIKLTLGLAALAAMTLGTQAQPAAAAKAPPPSAFDQWADGIKKPTDWLTWGADFRLRDEYLPVSVSLSEPAMYSEQNVVRFRSRVWASAMPVTNLSVNARLSAEPRYFTQPAGYGPFARPTAPATNRDGLEWRYGILDSFNVKWNNIADQPLSLTAGRQDIMLGDFYDWWLVADGTPGDGSWTFFLDSARLTYDAKELKTKFDLIYIYQSARPDEAFPTIGSARYSDPPRGFMGTDHYVTEQNEQGIVVYASNKSVKNTTIDGYFIFKRDDQETLMSRGALVSSGDNADIYTLGSKITGTPAEHWQYSIEGAYQFGEKQDPTVKPVSTLSRDINAYGGKAKLTYLAKDKLNNQFFLAGEFLSGDDPSTTDKDEMFDLLWGRWPRWSELYIYSYGAETSGKIAQINNLLRFGPGWTCSPMKGMTFSAVYNALFAPEEIPSRALVPVAPAAGGRFSGSGNFRGHYLQTVLKHQFNKHWQAHLWAEFVWEGDYYNQRDTMMFIRPEIMFTF